MGTNYYRIPKESEVNLKKDQLIENIKNLNTF